MSKVPQFTIHEIEIPKHLLGNKAGLVVRNTLKQVNKKLEEWAKSKIILEKHTQRDEEGGQL